MDVRTLHGPLPRLEMARVRRRLKSAVYVSSFTLNYLSKSRPHLTNSRELFIY